MKFSLHLSRTIFNFTLQILSTKHFLPWIFLPRFSSIFLLQYSSNTFTSIYLEIFLDFPRNFPWFSTKFSLSASVPRLGRHQLNHRYLLDADERVNWVRNVCLRSLSVKILKWWGRERKIEKERKKEKWRKKEKEKMRERDLFYWKVIF